ncbi:MAG: efflux RND transporter periplasmic adaptor subunit [Bacteroidota bacterium]
MKGTTLISAVLLLSITSGCGLKKAEHVEPAAKVPVKTISAEKRPFSITVHSAGKLASREEMKLSFKTGGIVSSLPAREGMTVKKGEVLARLNLSEIQAGVRQAELAVDKSYRDYQRVKNLYADSVATLEQLQNSRTAWELAKAQKQIADFNLQFSTISAPSDGKVLKVLVEANEMIAPGYPVLLFASTSGDWVIRSSLTDKDVIRVVTGDSAKVMLDAYPEHLFPAEVSDIAAMADPYTGTYEAEIRISSPLPGFRSGLIASVDIFTAGSDTLIWIPLSALLDPVDNRGYVYVVGNERQLKRAVTTAGVSAGGILIRDGLTAGEMVITEGAALLGPDSRIKIVN